MAYDTGLADRLRRQGLKVVEVAGWKTRGSSSFNPRGFVWHHTAGPARGNAPSLTICTYGRAGLPGPLCNVFLARDNTVYVVAAGRANHAGSGSWRGLSGNSSVYGLEIENTGYNTGERAEPWTESRLDAAAKIAKATGVPVENMCHHKEWTSRKIDMHTISGDAMRERVRRLSATSPGPAPAPVDWVALRRAINAAKKSVLRRGDKGDNVTFLQAGINQLTKTDSLKVDGDFGPATEEAVRNLERRFGLKVDGVAGPEVWAFLYVEEDPEEDEDMAAVYLRRKNGPGTQKGAVWRLIGNTAAHLGPAQRDTDLWISAVAGSPIEIVDVDEKTFAGFAGGRLDTRTGKAIDLKRG